MAAGHGVVVEGQREVAEGDLQVVLVDLEQLDFIQAELGQYRLVRSTGMTRDELPIFHGGAGQIGYLAYEVVRRASSVSVPNTMN